MVIGARQFFYLMLVVLVIGFGLIVGAFYWGDNQLEMKAATISDLQADRDIAREKVIALQKARRSTDNGDEAVELLDKLLPSTKSQEKLVADILYTATQEAGVSGDKISTLSFSTSAEPSDLSGTETFKEVPGVLSYPFSMTIQEIDYTTLLKLLEEIETNGRLVQVSDLQISPDKKEPGKISSVTLTMKAFLKP